MDMRQVDGVVVADGAVVVVTGGEHMSGVMDESDLTMGRDV